MPSILETVGPRSGSAPLTYTLTEAGTVDLMSVFASFDGAAAGGSFLPTVTVRSQNGAILARGFPGEAVAAGGSADVTFAPFLRQAASDSGTLETTDGTTLVSPTDTLLIGQGLTLTNPSAGVARIDAIPAYASYAALVAAVTDLVAYWPMDDPLGNQSDDSGYAPVKNLVRTAGTAVGSYQVAAPPAVVATGDTGGAVRLNYNQTTVDVSAGGGDNFAATDAGSPPKWAFGNLLPYTASAWVKLGTGWTMPSNAPACGIVTTHAPTGSGVVPGWGLFVNAPSAPLGSLTLYAHRGGGGGDTDLIAPSYAALTPGAWQHVAHSYDGATMFIYLNGQLVASKLSGIGVTGNTVIKVGWGSWNGSDQIFYGTIARVALFKRALSLYEIQQLALVR